MARPITYKLTCPKCGYTTTKTVGDAEIDKLLFIKCPKCGSSMKRESIARGEGSNIFVSFFDKFFKS